MVLHHITGVTPGVTLSVGLVCGVTGLKQDTHAHRPSDDGSSDDD